MGKDDGSTPTKNAGTVQNVPSRYHLWTPDETNKVKNGVHGWSTQKIQVQLTKDRDTGEPYAMKVACTVRGGAVGNVL